MIKTKLMIQTISLKELTNKNQMKLAKLDYMNKSITKLIYKEKIKNIFGKSIISRIVFVRM